MITLDHDTHIYKADGITVPSVTQILKDAGHIDDTFYTEDGCNRGSAVHEACQAIDNNDLTFDDFKDAEYFQYVQAYEKFMYDNDVKWELIEDIVYNEQLSYAGTLDRYGLLNGDSTLLDIKTGAPAFWNGLQLAAYKMAGNLKYCNNQRILFLRKDGTYRLLSSFKGQDFGGMMYTQYWDSIAKKNYYDSWYL